MPNTAVVVQTGASVFALGKSAKVSKKSVLLVVEHKHTYSLNIINS
jgi:hypothetical protein